MIFVGVVIFVIVVIVLDVVGGCYCDMYVCEIVMCFFGIVGMVFDFFLDGFVYVFWFG